MSLSPDLVRMAPKVALHDHLDGGLRPATVLDLSRQAGTEAPGRTEEEIADWFFRTADSGSLPRYLETFDVTVGLMQTAPALTWVAREFVEDMAADHVVYAETRWAPQQHLRAGLTLDQAVAAVQQGLTEGMDAARSAGTPVVARQLITVMRQLDPDPELARLTVSWLGRGVVGMDLAGPEAGFPASRFSDLFDAVRTNGGHLTIHAGEGDGLESIQDAIDCGAERLGHGARLVDDITSYGSGVMSLGPIATDVRGKVITLEVCPSSNIQTGVCRTLADHPIGPLWRAGIPVTISCDNRLMSATSMTRELTLVAEQLDWELADLRQVTLAGLEAAFCDEETFEDLDRTVTEQFDDLG
ncbi:adenosine deaminase [Acidipropionibacterium jensenii]|uniref:adenosine deaminase n=1 Tax=Acidipropionibacterium jensenii TaxID=1749 RepID=UPI002648C3B3|nr:adenosine deaminase [Acidipropionibacterium jensenii]MDN5978353.1 adenosine deaminase [Acidipropionibacterium jensenii]MDN5997561.1 adenosine deaminase [Acidipropionibacterium jensenii]MDN6427758.1 adenosine deaminase [Acidipropionibacterium jensenii]MDN6442440.1 adenosine deaminase [Acidipropionibacterium jensenii]MDN6481003.1 adenosine deaminase [Acidipropionibacterium jensenii]